jgi:serine/threonine protein kinase/tetratricopeptide (TPR) repeat protein
MYSFEDPNKPNQDVSGDTQPDASNEISSSAAEDTQLTEGTPESGPGPFLASPKSIGPYRLVRKLGEGGMGQVWLAEQTAPLQRLVAIKLIRAGVADGILLERFESERQVLARMNHPSIAKVYDAGSTPDGTPYFVMEYVPGIHITLYCDQKRLSIRQRLELFLKVCEGVQHAHQKAILHRDLKPANILVTEIDGKATPHIIDFGIAKAIAEHDPFVTGFTRAGHFIGTPVYVSPEQANPKIRDVDTRSDVYSLAIILYELLTGALPFDITQWRNESLQEDLRKFYEQDAPLPSIRFQKKTTTEMDTATQTAHRRSTEPRELVSQLRGDLDWITMKAMERDRARRYGSPSELAADLQRFLNNEPVTARPATATYRLQKYVRRHRLGVSVAAAAILLLIAFSVMQAMQIRHITKERDRTAHERDRANRVTDFMTRMFRVSDPGEARGNSITAREVLDKASKEIDTGLTQDPEMQAQMMHVMGDVYDNLGLYSRAMSLEQRTVEIRKRIFGPDNPDTLKSQANLAVLFARSGHYPEAEKLDRETLDTSRRVLGSDNPLTLGLTSNLAILLDHQGRFPESEQLAGEALDTSRRVLGPEHPSTLKAMMTLANVIESQGRHADAEKLCRETLDIRRRVLGPDHPETLNAMNNLASVLNAEDHYADAEKLYRETLDIQRRVLGPEHPVTLGSMSNLAYALANEGQYAEAEKMCRQSLEIRRRVLGPEHPDTLESMNNLTDVLIHEEQYDEAEKLGEEAFEIRQRTLGPENRETATSRYSLAVIAAHKGQRDKAFSFLQDALDHGLPGSALVGIVKDPDLKSLHGDSRFDALVAQAKQRAAVTQK